jgi:hypothetical protein
MTPGSPSTETFWDTGRRLPRRLFLLSLGITHLVAFASFWVQMGGLVGTEGIAPADLYMERLEVYISSSDELAWWQFPTLCWFFGASQQMLHMFCAAGCALALALVLGFAPRAALVGLWALYLSLIQVSSPFLNYQWDLLLIEVSFVAIFYAPAGIRPRLSEEYEPSPVAVWLLRLVLFKLILSSGLAKLNSGDSSWQDLTALDYHFWTQPIPHAMAWQVHNLGEGIRHGSVVFNHFVELCVPWLILFNPRGWKLVTWCALSLLTLWLGLGELSLSHSLITGTTRRVSLG